MSSGIHSTIFVLTDTPGMYEDALVHEGCFAVFVRTTDELLERLRNEVVAGLVLEVDKVMKASRQERDRLFNYAGNFPILRTRLNPRHGFVMYLDDKGCFFGNLQAAVGKRCRNHERIAVTMGCSFSSEEDPSLADSREGIIRDISPGGCFINSDTLISGAQFIHLRIASLANPRPIYCSVRWTRDLTAGHDECGLGAMFIDIAADQLAEISALQLEAPAP